MTSSALTSIGSPFLFHIPAMPHMGQKSYNNRLLAGILPYSVIKMMHRLIGFFS